MTQNTSFYPSPPPQGRYGIGKFVIGLSPIGATVGFDWQKTVISQYANSQRLLAIIASFDDAEDITPEFDAFYQNVWNILTAQGEGLDVWGRILGVSRILTVDTGDYFGFEEALPGSNGWNQQSWYAGPPSSGNYALSDPAYLTLLLAKAAFNICDGSIPAINQILMTLFSGEGNAYVQEGWEAAGEIFLGFEESTTANAAPWNQAPWYSGSGLGAMTINYVFDFALTAVQYAILTQSGVLPTPCGVTPNNVQNV